MISPEQAETFAAEWIAAWNSHDLARILSHYAEDFEFSSPFIVQIAGEPSGRLRGHAAVGAYWAAALQRIPDLRFERESVLRGMHSLVIFYRRFDGRRSAEWFEFGADGKVIRSAAQYAD
ncbi:nuclear transport factor 2 family protein [Solimonas fluminis]|uniref:Nuclear transport factor 2 family protein n=1 Tax=Solimonas fluminis TaxID=2086571 RepID=A0A2S5TJE9_9GAMM|nr:nuclear transport factor 2 family protein [Solimonas fluminis]PPE74928.1 nuclear transport factor 2 family protein [Solimonas fluminis]